MDLVVETIFKFLYFMEKEKITLTFRTSDLLSESSSLLEWKKFSVDYVKQQRRYRIVVFKLEDELFVWTNLDKLFSLVRLVI